MKPLLAIARLTWKSAFRFKLFWVLAVLLLGAVVGLPLILKDDGTARGFVQILLTYTLSVTSFLLGLATVWLACGSLARDVDECQIQMVAVKPVGRWQIWLGKWLGILALNTALLGVAGLATYSLLHWRASRLHPIQQEILRQEVMVARAGFKPEPLNLEEEIRARFNQVPNVAAMQPEDRAQTWQTIAEQVYAGAQIVPPRSTRVWRFDLGLPATQLGDQPLFVRVKFYAASTNDAGLYGGVWQFSTPGSTERGDLPPMRLASDSFQEFRIPSNLVDSQGRLLVFFQSREDVTLLFPLDEGIEILYRDGSFGFNFFRGLGILLAWLALLAALGLAAASITSFPVAAFCSLSVLVVIMSSGTLADSVSNQTVIGGRPDEFQTVRPVLDALFLPLFKGILAVVKLIDVASPVDLLSTGRSVTWILLASAWLQIVVVAGGFFAVLGIWLLNRRELATAQAAH
jgi:hypothetical protein